MRLAIYEPDIPPNTGTLIRLCACLDVPLDIIEPCGFPWSDKDLKRAAMDYGVLGEVIRHTSWDAFWDAFQTARPAGARLILMTTKTQTSFVDFEFSQDDILLVGRETSGVPPEIHDLADACVTIPMRPPARSLNMAVAASMVLSEALRQTGGFPTEDRKGKEEPA